MGKGQAQQGLQQLRGRLIQTAADAAAKIGDAFEDALHVGVGPGLHHGGQRRISPPEVPRVLTQDGKFPLIVVVHGCSQKKVS